MKSLKWNKEYSNRIRSWEQKKQNGEIFQYFGEDMIVNITEGEKHRLQDLQIGEKKQLAGLLKWKDKDRCFN